VSSISLRLRSRKKALRALDKNRHQPESAIDITGLGDRHPPESLIVFTGLRINPWRKTRKNQIQWMND
jgi:hypothetical protein